MIPHISFSPEFPTLSHISGAYEWTQPRPNLSTSIQYHGGRGKQNEQNNRMDEGPFVCQSVTLCVSAWNDVSRDIPGVSIARPNRLFVDEFDPETAAPPPPPRR